MLNEGIKAVNYCTIFPNTLDNFPSVANLHLTISENCTNDSSKMLLPYTQHLVVGNILLVSPADYALLRNVPFQMPALPPDDPVYLPGATQHQIIAVNRILIEQWGQYNKAVGNLIYLNQCLNSIIGFLTGPLHDTVITSN